MRALLAGLSLALLFAPVSNPSSAREKAPAPDVNKNLFDKQAEERLRKDVTFLASDECEGRGPTTAWPRTE